MKPKRVEVNLRGLIEGAPPHDIQAEAACLGCVLLEPAYLADVSHWVEPADFYDSKHEAIYAAMMAVAASGGRSDIVRVRTALAESGKLEQVGGVEYLLRVGESVPDATAAGYYARTVATKARRRRMADAAGKALYAALGQMTDDDAMALAESALTSVAAEVAADDQAFSAAELMQIVAAHLVSETSTQGGILTHYPILDDMIGGLHAGELTTIAGRPSMGKSAVMLCLAAELAAHDVPVGIVSLEMSAQEIGQRLLSRHSRRPLQAIRLRHRNLFDASDLIPAQAQIAQWPLHVECPSRVSITSFRGIADRMVTKHKVRVVFLDYLGLVTLPDAEREDIAYGVLTRTFKAIAREFEISIVALHQLNRQSESRADHRPKMSDLRSSGNIEQDSDNVVLVHREDYYAQQKAGAQLTNEVELIVAKQRQGPTGVVKLRFVPEFASMENIAHESTEF